MVSVSSLQRQQARPLHCRWPQAIHHCRSATLLPFSGIPQGVGGDSNEHVRVTAANLAWLELGGARFEGVHALLAREERAGAGIELSIYSAGIICGDLLSRCRLVLDYPRSRLAVVPPEE